MIRIVKNRAIVIELCRIFKVLSISAFHVYYVVLHYREYVVIKELRRKEIIKRSHAVPVSHLFG
jgi:hypothetical protein